MDGIFSKKQACNGPLAFLRPNVDKQEAVRLASLLYGLRVSDPSLVKEFVSYDDRNFYLKGALLNHSNEEGNQEQALAREGEFVMKILNFVDSQNIPSVNAQNGIMLHLKARGFVCPVPVRSLNGEYTDECKLRTSEDRESPGIPDRVYAVRLLTFVPGKLLKDVSCTIDLMFKLGCYIANMNKALQEFHHPDISSLVKQEWDLSQLALLESYICLASQNDSEVKVLQHVYNQFVNQVIPKLVGKKKQVIHGDLNDENIVVIPSHCSDGYEIGSVLDFGDASVSYRIFEVAICMMYMILLRVQQGDAHEEAIRVAGHVLRGYQSVNSLSQSELYLLFWSVAARFFQSTVIGLYKQSLEPENIYLSQSSQLKFKILTSYIATSGEEVLNSWLSIGPSD